MALKPVSVNEEAKKMLEEEVPKKVRHPHTIRYIERKLVDKGFHRMERHSGDGISLARGPPKSGHGGPFTWEGPDSELEPELAALDEADTNYVEEEVVKEMVVGEVEVAKVAEAREGVSRIEIRAPDQEKFFTCTALCEKIMPSRPARKLFATLLPPFPVLLPLPICESSTADVPIKCSTVSSKRTDTASHLCFPFLLRLLFASHL